ncbi:hypothetical protein Nepgr_023095 [Nepenthes gracilis]|uniref:Uncharacterized protein n=1 Tax=Nepenthes gracilis TaxID=150966 RepID=A0AAD3XXK9_NEPGR|nr:hypothetical protein Nepgr_023095 [Nepenthes gracilis]
MPLVLQTNEIADLADAPGVAECEPRVMPWVSVPAVTPWVQAGLDNGLGPNSPMAPSKSDSESFENMEVAETDLVAGFPRIASCPANLQLCYQQFDMDSPPNPIANTIETQNCECRVNGSPNGAMLLGLLLMLQADVGGLALGAGGSLSLFLFCIAANIEGMQIRGLASLYGWLLVGASCIVALGDVAGGSLLDSLPDVEKGFVGLLDLSHGLRRFAMFYLQLLAKGESTLNWLCLKR